MERTSLNDDVESRLPPEFLTDDDFLVEKENKLYKGDGFGWGSGFGRNMKPIGHEDDFLLDGLTRKMTQSSLGDDFYGGFGGNHASPADNNNYKAWGTTRSSLCGVGDGYNSGRGVFDLPRKHPFAVAAVKNPNDGAGYYYSRQSLQYHQKLKALQFQQLMQKSRGLKGNNNKIATQSSPSVWSNQPQRSDGSGMRAVFLTGKRRSTGTGVFLPRRVNHTSPETREKPSIATVLIPARVAEVLNLDESVVQPSVRSSASSLNEPAWRQRSYNGRFSSQMKMENTVIEPRLPSDWAY